MAFPALWDGTSPSRPNPDVVRGPDEQDWATLIHEMMITPRPKTQVMDSIVPAIQTTPGGLYMVRLQLTNLVITMTDATTAGSHGSQKIFEFESGNQLIQAIDFNLSFLAGAGGITDTAALVMAIGTVPTATDNATLTSTEANIQASTAATLVAGASTAITGNVTPKTVFGDMYLNLAVPDAGSTANDTITVSGKISFIWAPWF